MNCRIYLSLLAIALMATSAQADTIDAELEYDTNSNTWELYLEVGVAVGADGSSGIAGFVANFTGLSDTGVTFAPGNGALAPGGSTSVLDVGGGEVEFTYGQDLATAITGVGVTRELIADGVLTGTPAQVGLGDGVFLDPLSAPAPFTVIDADNSFAIAVTITDVTPGGGIVGDYDDSGQVAQGDLDLVLLNWGSNSLPGGFNQNNIPGGGPFDGTMSQNELDGVLLNWGNTVAAAAAAVPEPTSLSLFGLALVGLATRRRK